MKYLNRRTLCLTLGLTLGMSFSSACTKKKPSELSGGKAPKIFYHYMLQEAKTIDPQRQFDSISAQLVENLYDTLVQYNYLKRPYELEPALLEKMPEKQADGTYLFTIRKGVKFHDNAAFPGGKGRELSSDDAIFTLKRFADANVNDRSYSLMQGVIDGMDAFRELSKKAPKPFDYAKNEIAGIKKVDAYTFKIKFTKDSPLNIFPLAATPMSIVPHEAVEKYGDDFAKNPVGTGPFIMKSYSRRGTTVLARNPNYWEKFPTQGQESDKDTIADAGGKQLPFVDEVHLPLIEETQPAMLKFKKGQLHWVAIGKDDFGSFVQHAPGTKDFSLKPEFNKDFSLYFAPMLSTSFLKFGMRDPLLGKNKALRQAIALSLNTAGYVELILNGRGILSNSIVPVEIAGAARDTGSKGYTEVNLELAKKKLVEAGFPGGKGLPAFTIEYRASTKDQRQAFEFTRNELAKVGITVNGNFQTFSNFLEKSTSGNFQIADFGWNADYPDAENFYALLYGPNKAPLPNDGVFENAKYDELYLKSRDMPNGPERYKIFAEMDAIVKDEVPLINTFTQLAMGMTQNNVKNFKRNMMSEYPYKYFDLKE
ncbi:MAG: ABC transporter substrate-binding protein [Oligoflexus sp.]|nr:ABC transporter substrate-binding protein [Oligoflexus sp.]